MYLALVPALVALGFCVRDGFPDLKSHTDGKLGTQAARAFGGIFVLAGALVAMPSWWGAAIGLALVAGFWLDQEHAEGQQARGWADVGPLAVSGLTSLLPAAWIAAHHNLNLMDALLVAGLVAKPAIWTMAWRMAPNLTPTRIGAGVFGFLIGLVLVGGA